MIGLGSNLCRLGRRPKDVHRRAPAGLASEFQKHCWQQQPRLMSGQVQAQYVVTRCMSHAVHSILQQHCRVVHEPHGVQPASGLHQADA